MPMTTKKFITAMACLVGGIMILLVGIYVMKPGAPPKQNKPSQPQPPLFIEVDLSNARSIPDTLFGISFEEMNHAGAGGLWAELVSNRGFETGSMDPWVIIGGITDIRVTMELTSCFEKNKIALKMEVISDFLFDSGVGIYNPGYWGMSVEKGKTYKVILYSRSTNTMNVTVSFTSMDGFQIYASSSIMVDNVEWKKFELMLKAIEYDPKARLQLTTTNKGSIWFDQVSAMPVDTYKGQGFRKDLMEFLFNLKPRFLRFPGGTYILGRALKNRFRWKEAIGPWEDRPGHYNDVWNYWTDDGLGYLELLQLAEDLGAAPVWIVNAGIAINEQVNQSDFLPFVQDALDSIQFARGNISSYWGSLRAKYGHPKPFNLKYVAVGYQNCDIAFPMYRGNYLKIHNALKEEYPDINIISNCDPTVQKLDVPAEMFEYELFQREETVISKAHVFDRLPRSGPKVFVSEYAVVNDAHPNGSLIASLAEAVFLIGLERNSDVVSMACYAPLFMNLNDVQSWKPDAIYFDNWRAFRSPSYWVQSFFTESSGAFLLGLNHSRAINCTASAVRYRSKHDGLLYVQVKVINLQKIRINVTVTFKGVDPPKSLEGSKQTILTSNDPYDMNSLENPVKVFPNSRSLKIHKNEIVGTLDPYSMTSFDLHLT